MNISLNTWVNQISPLSPSSPYCTRDEEYVGSTSYSGPSHFSGCTSYIPPNTNLYGGTWVNATYYSNNPYLLRCDSNSFMSRFYGGYTYVLYKIQNKYYVNVKLYASQTGSGNPLILTEPWAFPRPLCGSINTTATIELEGNQYNFVVYPAMFIVDGQTCGGVVSANVIVS
jgi:hypothetical protein